MATNPFSLMAIALKLWLLGGSEGNRGGGGEGVTKPLAFLFIELFCEHLLSAGAVLAAEGW